MAYNNLRSKLCRAITAFLVQQNVGSVADIFPTNRSGIKKFPNTTITCPTSKVEGQGTGNRRVQVRISIKGKAVNEVGEPNREAARDAFDERVSATYDALLQTDDNHTMKYTARQITLAGRALAVAVDATPEAILKAENNADMVDFTVYDWFEFGEGDGQPDYEGCDWEEILIFECLACPSNVD